MKYLFRQDLEGGLSRDRDGGQKDEQCSAELLSLGAHVRSACSSHQSGGGSSLLP